MEKWMSDAIDKALALRDAIQKSGVYLDTDRIEITYINAVELCIGIRPPDIDSHEFVDFVIKIVDDGYMMTRIDIDDNWHDYKISDEIVDICKEIYFGEFA